MIILLKLTCENKHIIFISESTKMVILELHEIEIKNLITVFFFTSTQRLFVWKEANEKEGKIKMLACFVEKKIT